MTLLYWALAGWLVLVNLIAFAVYGADKRRAKKDKRRVPEKTLFLLAIIGVNMLKEAFGKEEEDCGCDENNADLSPKTMFVMAVATSIDALAVGISLAMAGNVNIWLAALFIGICTCGFSAAGVKIGNVFGSRFEKKAQMAGGFILILLGLNILLEHLGVLA